MNKPKIETHFPWVLGVIVASGAFWADQESVDKFLLATTALSGALMSLTATLMAVIYLVLTGNPVVGEIIRGGQGPVIGVFTREANLAGILLWAGSIFHFAAEDRILFAIWCGIAAYAAFALLRFTDQSILLAQAVLRRQESRRANRDF